MARTIVPTFIRLSATNPADWRTNVAQNVLNVDMDKEGVLFGLCCDQFGPKPLCFWTGYSPRAPLKATSHTFHNPIQGQQICPKLHFGTASDLPDKLLSTYGLESRDRCSHTSLTSRVRNTASVKTTLWLSERPKEFSPLLEGEKKHVLPWCSQSTMFVNQRVYTSVYNLEILRRLLLN